MATPMTADQLVAALRGQGLVVHEVRDWRNHNRAGHGAWGPVNGVMLHHTVTAGVTGTVNLCYDGRSDLPGPLCHGVIDKAGEVWLVGNGRANHAGLGDDDVLSAVINETALPAPNENNTDGNARFYGFECINLGDGTDPWPEAQLLAIEKASAAIAKFHGWSERSVIAHKEWTNQKVDPRGFTMDSMRTRIRSRLAGQEEEVVTPEDISAIAAKVKAELLGDTDLLTYIIKTDGVLKNPNPATAPANPTIAVGTSYNNVEVVGRRVDAVVADIAAKVNSLISGGVDLDALADRVADKLAARLAE